MDDYVYRLESAMGGTFTTDDKEEALSTKARWEGYGWKVKMSQTPQEPQRALDRIYPAWRT